MDLFKGLQAIFGGEAPASWRSTPKDESLRHQENDLYRKNIRLKEQLDEARERIVQLENRICSMEEERTKAEKSLDAGREEISQMIAEAAAQIRDSADQLEPLRSSAEKIDGIHMSMQQLDGFQESMQQIDGIREMIEKLDEQRISIVAVNEVAEELKSDITEKLHAENVKCYRNMKSLVNELEVKMEQMELGEESLSRIRKSFKGMKFFSFFSFLSFLAILAYILVPLIR